MKRIGIIGLGLMGGSLAMALKKYGAKTNIIGYARRSETAEKAARLGIVDCATTNPSEAIRNADMIVFCLPVLSIAEMAEQCSKDFSDGAIVTDVGSTKGELTKSMLKALDGTGAVYIGSHPIAGSDETGLDAAKADLYTNAQVIVTNTHAGPEENTTALSEVVNLWKTVGSKVKIMSPELHDIYLAKTSHLPHLVAAMLVNLVFEDPEKDMLDFCGSGFRDTTRIAAGSEEVWHDIVKTNSRAVADQIDALLELATEIRDKIKLEKFDEIKDFLARARKIRTEIYSRKTHNSSEGNK